MRRSQRLIATAVLIAFSSVLAGCSGGLSSFDPSDLLDFLDNKKKVQGERKPVFPDGVPGLEQGVPKELYKGSAQEKLDQQNAKATPAAPPADESKSKQAKSKSKTRQPATTNAATPAAGATAEPDAATAEDGGAGAVPPAPKPTKIVRKRTTAPPPDQSGAPPAPSSQPAQTQQSASPFPAPLPSGTFTR